MSEVFPPEVLAKTVADCALDRKGLDVVIIDLRGCSGYADFLVIASGTSDRHVQAIAENADEELAKLGVHAIGREGLRQGQWALIDFGSVVLHVFHQYTRGVYAIEELQKEAPRHYLDAENDSSIRMEPCSFVAQARL